MNIKPLKETPSMEAAKDFAFQVYAIDLALGAWAMERAALGLTVDEIKGVLSAAMEKAGSQ